MCCRCSDSDCQQNINLNVYIARQDPGPDGKFESLDGVDRTVLCYELKPVELGQTGEGIAGGFQVEAGVLHDVILLLLNTVITVETWQGRNGTKDIYLGLLTSAGVILVLLWNVHLHGLSVAQQVGESSWHF